MRDFLRAALVVFGLLFLMAYLDRTDYRADQALASNQK